MHSPQYPIETDPLTLFRRWYSVPLRELEKLPNGDGGFVVLATSCFLYERYAKAALDSTGTRATDEAMIGQLAADLQSDVDTATQFWDLIRNGFLHQAMPKQKVFGKAAPTRWETNGVFTAPFRIATDTSGSVLQIQPWLFRDRVLDLFEGRPDLIARNTSFPWGSIWRMA
jgi:hypothetical protein